MVAKFSCLCVDNEEQCSKETEAWALKCNIIKIIGMLNIKCLQRITDVKWFDRIRNARTIEMQFIVNGRPWLLKGFWSYEEGREKRERMMKGIYRSEAIDERLWEDQTIWWSRSPR